MKSSKFSVTIQFLTLKGLCISESCIEIKIKLNFYFHTSLWCLKRFYEGFSGLNFFTLSGIGSLKVNLDRIFFLLNIEKEALIFRFLY